MYRARRLLSFFLTISIVVFCVPALAAEGTALSIDTTTVYDGMQTSYEGGYTPSVSGNVVRIVLPLQGSVPEDVITVTPSFASDGPFMQGNYEFQVTDAAMSGVFLIDLTLPLKPNRVNGAYAVAFQTRYIDVQGALATQSFTVYVTLTNGIDPDYEPPVLPEPTPSPTPIVGQLQIASDILLDGMNKTYAQGYVPTVRNGMATIILPLRGKTFDRMVNITADLGATENTPFVFGNYSLVARGYDEYFFRFGIPLKGDRYNGAYPVKLRAEYLNVLGEKASQKFTVFITITDGKEPPNPNAEPPKEAVERPELYISACAVNPATIGGNESFTVDVTLQNIGRIRARSVRITYGSEAEGIVPENTNNAILLEPIASGDTDMATFKLRTTKDVLAGNQTFFITLDYVDLYGGIYTATRQFLVKVTQPVNISYDTVSLPKEITAGETISLPANVFNVGKSTLRNVTVMLEGAGLFPTSSVFLGDILPGEAGYGEMKIFIGMLSRSEGHTESYGKTSGKYIISYQDDLEEAYSITLDVSTEIKKPVIEGEDDQEKDDPAAQWWMSMIIGLAIIAIIVTVIIVSKFTRMMRLR